jgi:hypothetical protein
MKDNRLAFCKHYDVGVEESAEAVQKAMGLRQVGPQVHQEDCQAPAPS